MLAADILGFHTRYHCQNFLATVDRFIECQIDHEHMTVTLADTFAASSPTPFQSNGHRAGWRSCRTLPTRRAQSACAAMASSPESVWAAVSSDGISPRASSSGFRRWKRCSKRTPIAGAESRFCRSPRLPAANCRPIRPLQEQTLSEVKRINDTFGTADWKPIVLIDHHQEPREVFELFRAADFCVVNSLHDGMNLVAKEFVAARDDQDGVLIFSTFAGASRELPEALLVNPFDVGETAAAMRLRCT